MKKFLSLFVVLTSLVAVSQTPSPSPTPTPSISVNSGVHFSEETAVFPLQGGGTATAITARLPLTGHFSFVATDFQIPGIDAITVAGVEYRTTLAKLFGKNASKSQVNLSKMHLFGRVELGSEAVSTTTQHNFATYFAGGLEYPLGTVMGGKVYGGATFGRVDLPGVGSHYILGSQNQISPHVAFNF